LGIGVKKYGQVTPTLLSNDALSDGPLSLIDHSILRALLRLYRIKAAARQEDPERRESRQKHFSNNGIHDFLLQLQI
jgi:hypothetical protein